MDKHRESLETMVARIDERVNALPDLVKTVARHDMELLIGKVFIGVCGLILAIKFPVIADVVARAFQ